LSLNQVQVVTNVAGVANQTAMAGMDREQFINVAKQTYTQSIRSRLEFI
jgi:predicted double-glycine peptidase